MDKRNLTVLKPNCSKNSLSVLNEMQFTNSFLIECQIILFVPIVPWVPMDKRNPTVLTPNRSKISLSLLNEMQFSNGVPMEYHIISLVPILPLVPIDQRSPAVYEQYIQLYSNRTVVKIVKIPVNEMQFTNGVPIDIKSFYCYQWYNWNQWTNGVQLYSNRTVAKIV